MRKLHDGAMLPSSKIVTPSSQEEDYMSSNAAASMFSQAGINHSSSFIPRPGLLSQTSLSCQSNLVSQFMMPSNAAFFHKIPSLM